ncbi:MAG: hypothetical protein ACU0C9_04205 [Paracoccaceae bacterium]
MLLRMAAPISLGILSTFLFQIVDTQFVGKLGSAELAALAFSPSAYLLFLSVFIGIGPMPGVWAGLRDIIRSCVPTISMQILVPAAGMFMTYLPSAYRSEAVAAFGADGGQYCGGFYAGKLLRNAERQGSRPRLCGNSCPGLKVFRFV